MHLLRPRDGAPSCKTATLMIPDGDLTSESMGISLMNDGLMLDSFLNIGLYDLIFQKDHHNPLEIFYSPSSAP